MQPDEWRGHIHRPSKPTDTVHLHNLFEIGEPFERLIDHPAWLAHMERYVGGDDGLFIDESFADVRAEGAATMQYTASPGDAKHEGTRLPSAHSTAAQTASLSFPKT